MISEISNACNLTGCVGTLSKRVRDPNAISRIQYNYESLHLLHINSFSGTVLSQYIDLICKITFRKCVVVPFGDTHSPTCTLVQLRGRGLAK